MKQFGFIIVGIILALIEIAVHVSFYGIGVELAAVSLVAIALVIVGNYQMGATIMLTGACVLDIFSPYRFGIYLLSAVIALLIFKTLLTRLLDPYNPVLTWFIFLGSFIILHLFVFLGNPMITVLLATAVVNAFLGTIITAFMVRLPGTQDKPITVSKDVNFR